VGYTEAALLKADFQAYWRSDAGRRNFLESLRHNRTAGDAYLKIVHEVSYGEPVWVAAPICDLLVHGLRSWNKGDSRYVLHREDILVNRGFCVFEKPLPLPEVPEDDWEGFGPQHGLRAISWEMGYLPEDDRLVWDRPPARGALSFGFTFWGTNPGPHRYLFHSSGWIEGDSVSWRGRLASAQNMSRESTARADVAESYMMQLMLFMRKRILVARTERVNNKGVRNRIEKATKAHVPGVKVIELRRRDRSPYQAGSTGRTVQWTKQWPVVGHWRDQWHGPNKPSERIWIDPYVKGPEGLPLVVPQVAWEVVR
jgi:hypothetical protein